MEKIFSEILENASAEAENAVRVAKKIADREVEYAKAEAAERSERYKSENTAELLALSAAPRERPRESFFNASRGPSPLP